MKILFVSAELSPLCQTGGLGDAVSGLARALARRGHEIVCAIPGYRDVFRRTELAVSSAGHHAVDIPYGDGALFGLFRTHQLYQNVQVIALDLPSLYEREGLYGDENGPFPDNALRFLALSQAAVQWACRNSVDMVVAHDHHAAMALCYLRTHDEKLSGSIGAVQVVHNNAYQGRYPAAAFSLAQLPESYFQPSQLEAYGSLCLLKGGLVWADHIITVSPTYAKEIQESPCGEGLEGVYLEKNKQLTGIRNGIDIQRFDPNQDTALSAAYSSDALHGKSLCRQQIMNEMGLDAAPLGRFCVAIGRLAHQKGWDLLSDAIDRLVADGFVFALLGDGDAHLAEKLELCARSHRGRVAFHRGYDEQRARRLYAGADAILVPSRFEPCGLVQLIAQRYGTLPIASAVGGLCDTIIDERFSQKTAQQITKESTGILFDPQTPDALFHACQRLREIPDEAAWKRLQKRLLALDVSWDGPAAEWESVLMQVHSARRSHL
jgi:starch synthase